MTKIKICYLGDLKTECTHEASQVKIITSPPRDVEPKGGVSFSPTDLFAISLGSCMLTLMAMAAQKADFEMEGTTVDVEKEMSSSPPRKICRLAVRIRCPRKPNEPLRLKFEKAALECPVSLSLHPEIKKEIEFIWGL